MMDEGKCCDLAEYRFEMGSKDKGELGEETQGKGYLLFRRFV